MAASAILLMLVFMVLLLSCWVVFFVCVYCNILVGACARVIAFIGVCGLCHCGGLTGVGVRRSRKCSCLRTGLLACCG